MNDTSDPAPTTADPAIGGGLLRLEIEVPEADADAAEAVPWRLGAQGVMRLDGADVPPGHAVICAWLPADEGEALHALAIRLLGPLADRARLRLVPEDPRSWQATLQQPITVGGFVVEPDLDPDADPVEPPDGDARRLLIEPGSAFGDGAHPTTALCVAALEARFAAVDVPPPATVLDVGTGTGLLALVAAALGARAVGTDIDPLARRAAARHARRNGLADRVRIAAAPPDTRFDLVVANLYLDPLVALAPTLAARVAPGGRCVVSGIARRHRDRIERVFAAAGLRALACAEREGWIALTFAAPHPVGDHGPAEVSDSRADDGRTVHPETKREPT